MIRTDRHPGVGGEEAATFRSAPFGAFGEQTPEEYHQRLAQEAKEGNVGGFPRVGVYNETTQPDFDLFREHYSAAAEALGYRRTDFIDPTHIEAPNLNGRVAETVVADFSKRQK